MTEEMGWRKLAVDEAVDLEGTLFSGQVFTFKRTGQDEYTGPVRGSLVSFRQEGTSVSYSVLYSQKKKDEVLRDIEEFLALGIELGPLLSTWGLDDEPLLGLRPIKYDLIPTVFSFICSSNNNIARIARMVDYLFSKGRFIMKYRGIDFYLFPELECLTDIEDELRERKFGYRARYVCDAARRLLESERRLEASAYPEAKRMLMEIHGIGNKVADCICLIGMGYYSVVPIDTHILRFSREFFGLKLRPLNEKAYSEIQRLFLERYGTYAGIAQLYIFKGMLEERYKKRQKLFDQAG
jgi:N-glycosylase/DNA lyase